ncbi:hypothetical protein IPA_06135 [Ignicoccus pacificus DSM 13166]|uniref:HTH tetR-type domain-containing protein n=1 Tax=Ignicoccus pacificus DSM 13166 TaxID=940294 RepID=A0A977KBD3_9CREN|nr:hypothetical protein IPA_06135 [Ignicoccus pacificus DSM 13166]
MPEGKATRENILNAAKKVFADMGFSKASVEIIAREANVSKSLVFWYFKNKRELIQEVVKEILPKRIIMECLDKDLKGEELLRCVIRNYINLLSDEVNKKLALHLIDMSITDEEYKKLYDEFCEEGLAKLAEKLFCKEPGELEMAAMRGLHGMLICNIIRGQTSEDILTTLALNLLKPLGLCS